MTDMGAHQFGTSLPVVGNRYNPSLPTWAQGSSGTVTQISPGTSIQSAANAGGAASYPGTGSADLASPWSGGAVVSIDSRPYLVCLGGGHTDGSWNGHVGFGPLTGSGSDDPDWSVVFPASSTGSVVQNSTVYSDGRQSSNHTYNNLVGVGDTLYHMASGGYYGSSGNGSLRAFKVVNGTTESEIATNPTDSPAFGSCAHYDGKIYYFSSFDFDNLHIYDIAANTWSNDSGVNGVVALGTYVSMAADPARGNILCTNGSSAYLWDAATLSRQSVNAPGGYDQCLEFDEARDVFVSLNGGSSTIYELRGDNPTGSWTTRSYSGSTPASGVPAGTYGRFRYVPQLGGCLIVPSSSSNVWFFKS